MLRDELGPLQELVAVVTSYKGDGRAVTMIGWEDNFQRAELACRNISNAWLNAVFSDLPDHSMKRYFEFHLEGIVKLSDTLWLTRQDKTAGQVYGGFFDRFGDLLNELMEVLIHRYPAYFHAASNTPRYWRTLQLQKIDGRVRKLISRLRRSGLNPALQSCVLSYIQEIRQTAHTDFCSFHALRYYAQLVGELSRVCSGDKLNEPAFHQRLIWLNFNRLDYLMYYQKLLKIECEAAATGQAQMNFLRGKKTGLFFISNEQERKCQEHFPDLATMLMGWLDEELETRSRSMSAIVQPALEKVVTRFSVPQLACIIRLLREEDLLPMQSLSNLFKLVAVHYSSVMQDEISPGSISKEFYGISQSTALKTGEILQKMLSNLKRNFFPLLVVASVIAGVL